MENYEDSNADLKESKMSTISVDNKVKKLKIKRFRRKEGEKKTKKDPARPRHPLTGYIRYMNVRREELKKLHPESTAIELTKIIGEEWNKLSDEIKKPFLDAAELDKERYHKEYAIYEANKAAENSATDVTDNSPPKINGTHTKPEKRQYKQKLVRKIDNIDVEKSVRSNDKIGQKRPAIDLTAEEPPAKLQQITGEFIPIFTEQFIFHNKTVDTNLRLLRKSTIDFETQNSVLEKHVDNIQTGLTKFENENLKLMERNHLLDAYISQLRIKLALALAGVSIPGISEPCGTHNVDNYMHTLQHMAENAQGPPSLLNKVKDIIRKLDLFIQLL